MNLAVAYHLKLKAFLQIGDKIICGETPGIDTSFLWWGGGGGGGDGEGSGCKKILIYVVDQIFKLFSERQREL